MEFIRLVQHGIRVTKLTNQNCFKLSGFNVQNTINNKVEKILDLETLK